MANPGASQKSSWGAACRNGACEKDGCETDRAILAMLQGCKSSMPWDMLRQAEAAIASRRGRPTGTYRAAIAHGVFAQSEYLNSLMGRREAAEIASRRGRCANAMADIAQAVAETHPGSNLSCNTPSPLPCETILTQAKARASHHGTALQFNFDNAQAELTLHCILHSEIFLSDDAAIE